MDPFKPLTDSTKPKSDEKLKADEKRQDAWHGHRFHGAGIHSSEATLLVRGSSHTLVVVTATSSNFAVRLPITAPSTIETTAKSTEPVPAPAVVGDMVEVCVDPASERSAYVWYDATSVSDVQNYEEVTPGKCRLYRYVSGAVWNRYT